MLDFFGAQKHKRRVSKLRKLTYLEDLHLLSQISNLQNLVLTCFEDQALSKLNASLK